MASRVGSFPRFLLPRRPGTVAGAIREISRVADKQANFFGHAHGWAPEPAADLLGVVRLNQYSSLARVLELTILTPHLGADKDGRLIVGWSHLGSLLECTLQIFLGVWLRDYLKDPNQLKHWKTAKLLLPHELTLEQLRVFFDKSVWDADDKKNWSTWIQSVQLQRNAIHVLKPRPLEPWAKLEESIKTYCVFLSEMDSRMPYPAP